MKNIFLLFHIQFPLPEISAVQLMCCVGRVAEINCLGSTSSMSSILDTARVGVGSGDRPNILYLLDSLRLFLKHRYLNILEIWFNSAKVDIIFVIHYNRYHETLL